MSAECISGLGLGSSSYTNLEAYVGPETLKALGMGCNCPSDTYGPLCTWNKPNEQQKLCIRGQYNKNNFLSGCECKDELGNFLMYHGWYCEIPNRDLCDQELFYDSSKMNKVGDNRNLYVCKECNDIKGIQNCASCRQDEFTECK